MFKFIQQRGKDFIILDTDTMVDEVVDERIIFKALNNGIKIDGIAINGNKLILRSLHSVILKRLYNSDRLFYDGSVFTSYSDGIGISFKDLKRVGSFSVAYIPSFVSKVHLLSDEERIKVTGGRGLTDCSGLLSASQKVVYADLSDFKPLNVTRLCKVFAYCSKLKKVTLGEMNTDNLYDMNGMFFGCRCLDEVDLSMINTSNVEDMSDMFRGCVFIKSINLNGFDTRKVKYTSNMFFGCSNLEKLDVSHFNLSSVRFSNHMFYKCTKLKYLDVRNFNFNEDVISDGIIEDCPAQVDGIENIIR